MEVHFTRHANERVVQRGLGKRLLIKLIHEEIPEFVGTIDWKFSNGYYAILFRDGEKVVVITVGKGVKGRYGKHNSRH